MTKLSNIISALLLLFILLTVHSCREGCTDYLAENFDPKARSDDGSCIVHGCTDFSAANYDPDATHDDGSCISYGCTDKGADNFDPKANIDDGSCYYYGHVTFWSNNGINMNIDVRVNGEYVGTLPTTDPSNLEPQCMDNTVGLTVKLQQGYHTYNTSISTTRGLTIGKNTCDLIRIW